MTWSFVQAAGATSSTFDYVGNVASAGLTLTGVTAGNLLVFAVGALNDGTLSVSDNNGNTWSTSNRIAHNDPASVNNHQQLWWCPAVNAGSTTVTVTRTGGTISYFAIYLAEYDYSTNGTISLVSSAQAWTSPTSTSHTSGSTAGSAAAGDLVLGQFFRATDNLAPAPADGKTTRASQEGTLHMSPALSEVLSATAGTQSAAFSTSSANNGLVQVAVLRETPAVLPPADFANTAVTETTADFSWTAASGASFYELVIE